MNRRESVHDAQLEFQRQAYESHFPKRAAVVRSQLAHPLFSSFNDRVAGLVLDAAGGAGAGPGDQCVINGAVAACPRAAISLEGDE